MTEFSGWTVSSKKPHRHVWMTTVNTAEWGGPHTVCQTCGKDRIEELSRRGRLNRSRGNAIERYVCHLLGIKRVGQFGGLEDGGGSEDRLVVQVKSGGAFQTALLSKIHTIPTRGDQLRAWVTVSTPGAGRKREGVISFDLQEFAMWYGAGLPGEPE